MTSEFEFPMVGEAPDLDLSVAVVGCGSIGQRHIRSLLKMGPRVVGVDPRDVKMPDAVKRVRTLREAGQADAVLVCTPASERIGTIRKALSMGAHLFVEKPLALTYEAAQKVSALVAEYPQRVVMMGYNLRFDPDLQTFAASLPDLGPLIGVEVRCSSWLPDWRAGRDYRETPSAKSSLGGGILREASHELDLVNWLFGFAARVEATMARTSSFEIDVEDTVDALIDTHSGVPVGLHLDFCTPGYERTVRVFAQGTSAEWHLLPGSPMYELEMAHFLDCVVNGRRPAVTAADGLRAMALDAMIREAARSERKAA